MATTLSKQQILSLAGIDGDTTEKGKYKCPKCDEYGVSVNKHTGRARCWAHGGCGWYFPKRNSEKVADPVSEALAALYTDWKRALLFDTSINKLGIADGFRKRALRYLREERGIGDNVISMSRIGMVPNTYNPEPIIADARAKVERQFEKDDKDTREAFLGIFDDRFANELRAFCGKFGKPNPATGLTSASREGWLAFFYENADGEFVAVNFRSLDKTEDGDKIVRMWQPVPGRRGVFNPVDGGCTLGGNGDRVLVMEGEFNQLQFLSAYRRVYGDEWMDEVPSCVTAGSSSGVDTKTLWQVLQNVGVEGQTMYAVVNEDADAAGTKVTEQIAEGGFTYYFSLPEKDMDEFIKAIGDDEDALDEVTELAANAPLYYCPIESARTRLNELRCNPPDPENGLTDKGKPKKAPKHIRDRKVFDFVKHDIMTRSRLFLSAYPYIYRRDTHELVKLVEKSPSATEFLQEYDLMAKQDDTGLVAANLQAFLLNPKNVEAMGIHKLGCIQRSQEGKHTVYANKGDGHIFRITADSVEVVENGTDDIFMLDEQLKPWPNLTKQNVDYMKEIAAKLNGAGIRYTPDTPLCYHLRELYDQQTLTQSQCQQMSFQRFMFVWVANSCELWPIEFKTGIQNVGKSTGFEKRLTLLYGLMPNGEGFKGDNLPPDRRSLIAGLTNASIKLYDNIDSVDFGKGQKGYLDTMCGVATGMNASMAMLYENNVELSFNLKTHLYLTARVCPIQRSDAMRRVIQLAIRKPSPEEHVSKDILIREMMEQRDECLLELLVRLQNIVRGYDANYRKRYTKLSEMPEYEEWSYRLAEYEGFLPEQQDIWKKYADMYQDMIQESNPLAYAIKCWLGRDNGLNPSNVGRQIAVSGLWAELQQVCDELGIKQTYTSSSSFGKRLKENMSELRGLGYKTNGYTGGKNRIWFELTPEQVEDCNELYKSLSDARDRYVVGPGGSLASAHSRYDDDREVMDSYRVN